MPHYNTPMIWRLDKDVAGSGALGDLGAHIIDLGRFLVGEVDSVSAALAAFRSPSTWSKRSSVDWAAANPDKGNLEPLQGIISATKEKFPCI